MISVDCLRFEFKPADVWLGLSFRRYSFGNGWSLDVWVCWIPMVPLHVRLWCVRPVPRVEWR